MRRDQIVVVNEGTEITVEAALADIDRAGTFLANDVQGVWYDDAQGLAADLFTARSLLDKLARESVMIDDVPASYVEGARCIADALDCLNDATFDPEGALASLGEAAARIEAAL